MLQYREMVMIKTYRCAAALVALLLLVGAVEATAQSIHDFPCQIDLGQTDDTGAFVTDPEGLVIPQEFRTSYGSLKELKVCQGTKNVRVSCDALIKDWPFKKNFVTSDLTCCINTQECGISNGGENAPCGSLVEAESVSLRITATKSSLCGPDSSSCGVARLECRLR
jgi:hypothetical protein